MFRCDRLKQKVILQTFKMIHQLIQHTHIYICTNTWYKYESLLLCAILNALCTFVLCNFFLSSANKCLLKVGAYCAQLEQYQKAIEIYEQVCTTFISTVYLHFLDQHWLGDSHISHTFCMIWMFLGRSQHDGQSLAEIQRQRVLLQSLPLSFHRRRAQR